MFRIISFTLFVIANVTSVYAVQKFEEFRIFGSEIRSVKIEPQEVEAPATMIITVGFDDKNVTKITVESDEELDSCKQQLDAIIGNKQSYAQIVVHVNAETMNGVFVTQCSVFQINN